jgi:hypothetical protein
MSLRATGTRSAYAAEVPGESLEKSAQECRRFIRDADDRVRCLTIEFEIELGFGPAVVPVSEALELAPSRGRFTSAVRLTAMLTRGVCRAMPSFCAIAGGGDDGLRDEAMSESRRKCQNRSEGNQRLSWQEWQGYQQR